MHKVDAIALIFGVAVAASCFLAFDLAKAPETPKTTISLVAAGPPSSDRDPADDARIIAAQSDALPKKSVIVEGEILKYEAPPDGGEYHYQYRRHGRTRAIESPEMPAPPAEAPLEPESSAQAAVPALSEDSIEAAIAATAVPAKAVLQINEEMFLGREYTARLSVERGAGEDLPEFTKQTIEPVVQQLSIRSTAEVSVTATAQNIKITSQPAEWQTLVTNAINTWEWSIEPKSKGKAQFTVSMKQQVMVGDTMRVVNVKLFPVKVDIKVDAWAQVGKFMGVANDSLKTFAAIGQNITAIGLGLSAAWAARKKLPSMLNRSRPESGGA